MSKRQEVETRDRRRKGWFSVDDEVIDRHGPDIGAHGIAVYAALCKHADKNEQTRVGLTALCKKLKIGRDKLLKTLGVLEAVGLIGISSGDRSHVSVYTLLHVAKIGEGGSDENQAADKGGSNENQGGSNENQVGGSDQNRNQTTANQTPNTNNTAARAKPREEREEKYRQKIDEALDDDVAADSVQAFIDMKESETQRGQKTQQAIWNQIVAPYVGWRDEFPDEARIAGIETAVMKEARSINFARAVAEDYKPRAPAGRRPAASAQSQWAQPSTKTDEELEAEEVEIDWDAWEVEEASREETAGD